MSKFYGREIVSNSGLCPGEQVTAEAQEGVRKFETGATRDTVKGKPSYVGFLSVDVIKAYGEYMLKNQHIGEPNERKADNWKLGIPLDAYMDSMFRHFVEVWDNHGGSHPELINALCALLFNVMGYLHEVLNA